MNHSRSLFAVLLVGLSLSVWTDAQRPPSATTAPSPEAPTRAPVPGMSANVPPAPNTVKVKYEGGVFGYNQKMDGTLTFDDENKRLVFHDKKTQTEKISINYKAIATAFADTQSKRPVAAQVASQVPLYGLPALLIKKKYRYLTLQFNDPDSNATGITSFKMENKEILASVLYTLAEKARMTQRGDIFIRRKDTTSTTQESRQD
jgi:hypothetical protein